MAPDKGYAPGVGLLGRVLGRLPASTAREDRAQLPLPGFAERLGDSQMDAKAIEV